MTVARLYRFELDWKAQRPRNFEDGYVGDIPNIIVGAASSNASLSFPKDVSTVSTEGQIGLPVDAPRAQPDDFLVFNNRKYQVISPPFWDTDHAFAGGTISDDVSDYYWVDVRASS